jgi:hypothetical protein
MLFVKFVFPSTKFSVKFEVSVDHRWNGTDMGKRKYLEKDLLHKHHKYELV